MITVDYGGGGLAVDYVIHFFRIIRIRQFFNSNFTQFLSDSDLQLMNQTVWGFRCRTGKGRISIYFKVIRC